jgi:hypothetical protein
VHLDFDLERARDDEPVPCDLPVVVDARGLAGSSVREDDTHGSIH